MSKQFPVMCELFRFQAFLTNVRKMKNFFFQQQLTYKINYDHTKHIKEYHLTDFLK